MTKNEFLQNFKDYNFIILKDKYIVNRKPLYITLLNEEEDNRIKFKHIEDLLKYELEGETILDIVSKQEHLGNIVLNGGRGASSSSSGKRLYKFSSQQSALTGAPSPRLLVAKVNTAVKKKSQENVLKWFSDNYKNAKREFAVEVDDNGFAHQFFKGKAHSVEMPVSDARRKGVRNTMIYHNHPSGGAFSDADLINTAMSKNTRGIVAAGSKYNYIFKKRDGGKFKASSFAKAVSSAKLRGANYNEAAHNWLKANQKKYGYTYKRENV